MPKKEKKELTRISMNLPTTLADKIKDYADMLGLNFTSACIVLLNDAIVSKYGFKSEEEFQNYFDNKKDLEH